MNLLGIVNLTRLETITRDRGGQGPCARSLRGHDRTRDLLPDPESLGHLLAIFGGRELVTRRSEVRRNWPHPGAGTLAPRSTTAHRQGGGGLGYKPASGGN